MTAPRQRIEPLGALASNVKGHSSLICTVALATVISISVSTDLETDF